VLTSETEIVLKLQNYIFQESELAGGSQTIIEPFCCIAAVRTKPSALQTNSGQLARGKPLLYMKYLTGPVLNRSFPDFLSNC